MKRLFNLLKKIFKDDKVLIPASISTLFGLFVFLFSIISEPVNMLFKSEKKSDISIKEISKARAELTSVKSQIENINDILFSKDTLKYSSSQLNNKIISIKFKIDSLEKRFAKIEQIIFKEPNEVLELPLLKKEIESTRLNNDSKFSNLTKDIERAYSIIFISLVSLAVTVFAHIFTSRYGDQKDISE